MDLTEIQTIAQRLRDGISIQLLLRLVFIRVLATQKIKPMHT
jgi:hypothetical protein